MHYVIFYVLFYVYLMKTAPIFGLGIFSYVGSWDVRISESSICDVC